MVTPKRLVEGTQLGVAASTLYTTPDLTVTKILILTVTNPTATARTVTVYLVPSGGTANNASTVISARTVAPGQDIVLSACAQVMQPGDTIQALASAAGAITLMASGVEITS